MSRIGRPCLYWQGHPFSVEVVVLGGFSLTPPDLFLQDLSLPAVVEVLEGGLIPYPVPPCMGLMVLECPFQDPAFLYRILTHKTLKSSFQVYFSLGEYNGPKRTMLRILANKTLKSNFQVYFSLGESSGPKRAMLRLSCFLSFVRGHNPRVLVFSWAPDSDVWEAAGSSGSCLYSLLASVFYPVTGLLLTSVAGSDSSLTSPAVIESGGMSQALTSLC